MIEFRNARSDEDFEQILELQRRNLRRSLTEREQNDFGFVYLEHDVPLLRKMASALPQAIAVSDKRVVGYCLALSPAFRASMPWLEPMFLQCEQSSFDGSLLASYRYFVGGQVCVDREFRGQGLAGRLYRQVRDSLTDDYQLCVTEIASRNQTSIRSHEKIGFVQVAEHSDGVEDWVLVVWKLAA
jgi:ribosomal protein S18 acetylase RimI-like enzyme